MSGINVVNFTKRGTKKDGIILSITKHEQRNGRTPALKGNLHF